MQDPIFGKIKRSFDGWRGSLHVPFFTGFGRSFADQDERDVRVYVDEKKEPSSQQTAAYETFRENENAAAKAIKEALFDYYQTNLKTNRNCYTGRSVYRAIPKIKTRDDLKDITELDLLNVFPEKGEHPLAIGLLFKGSWTGPAGIGVRWSEGRIEAIGKSEVATPGVK